MSKLTQAQKDEIISRLIANEGVECDGCDPWTEEDTVALNALPEDKLVALDKLRQLATNMPGDEEEDEEDEEEEEEEATPKGKGKFPFFAKNKKKKPTGNTSLVAEYLASAPPEVRSVVTNAINFEHKQKVILIKKITANEKNQFDPKFLQGQDLEVLQGIAALAVNEEAEEVSQSKVLMSDYSGVPGIVRNLSKDFASEDQDMISGQFDWATK